MSNQNQHKPGYKHTPLGWIPEEWEIHDLGSLINIISGDSPVNYELSIAGKYPYIKVEDLNNNEKYQTFSREYCNEEKRSVPAGSVIFPKRGAAILNNKVRINSVSLYMDSNLMAIYPSNGKLDGEFLFYKIKQKALYKIADTSSIPQLNNKHLTPLRFELPQIIEQRKIAAILSTWDEAITKTQQLIVQLQRRNKGLMQHFLTAKDNWKEYRIGDLLKEVKRPVAWNDEELYNLISVRRRSGGAFFRESLYGKQILTKQLFTAEAGDFLISKMQIVHGASAVVLPEFAGMKISGSYIAVHAKDETVMDIHFFNWLSKTKSFYKLAYISSYGVHIEKMTFDFNDFKRRKIMLPPTVEEQNRIVNILQTACNEMKLHEQKLTALQQQKKGLMQILLTGQVRVGINSKE